MIGNSRLAQLAVACAVLIMTAVAPLAFIHHLLHLVYHSPLLPMPVELPFLPAQLPAMISLDTLLHYWLGVELLFYVYFLTTRRRLQYRSEYVPLSHHESQTLFLRCIEECGNLPEFLTGYFRRADTAPPHLQRQPVRFRELYRDNIREWLAWCFFGHTLEEVYALPTLWQQLNWMLDHVEARKEHRFPTGYNPDITAMRLNLDPVHSWHRPCLFYVGIFTLDTVGKLLLWAAGFRRYGRAPRHLTSVLANTLASAAYSHRLPSPRTETTTDRTSTATTTTNSNATGATGPAHRAPPPAQVTYWYRPGNGDDEDDDGDASTQPSSSPRPIVFVHGIGAGIAPYLLFIWHIYRATHGRAPLYLVELPHVSMRFHDSAPTIPDTARELDAALGEHGHHQAVVVGHSLGSAVVAGFCRAARKRVAAAVLVDPICFLLHRPNVAVNFVHRKPRRANEHFVNFFASRELFISHFISRQFHWYHSCLWADELPAQPANTTVFLSRDDLLVPSAEVADYLDRQGVQHRMMPLDHAQFLMNRFWQTSVVDQITQYACA